jgi:mRNA-degrading endonuclease toxin of MazEF toxin-antitoxin module
MNQIVIAKFPFLDKTIKHKTRPVFCLTKPTGKHKLLIVAYITSKKEDLLETDLFINKNDPEFKLTNLINTSIIKTNKLLTISVDQIIGSLGVLPKHKYKELKTKLKQLFDL